MNYEKIIPWGKPTQQATVSNCEKIRENGIDTVAVVRNFNNRLDVVIDKKGRHLWHSLFCCVFINNVQFVINL